MPGDHKKYFIDIHCHLFNIEHVPLRITIRRITENFNTGLLKKAGTAVMGSVFTPILALSGSIIPKHYYKTFEEFIRFFDQPIESNIHSVVGSASEIKSVSDMSSRIRIFTPLIMDFEKCEPYKSLANQASDLQAAIKNTSGYLSNHQTLILPFIGMDLGRFHKQPQLPPSQALDDFFSGIKVSFNTPDARRDPSKLANGDYVGIKLYPSLGFDIFPQDTDTQKRNAEILERLGQMDLPITTHCQEESYVGGDEGTADKTLVNFASPYKWWQLMEKYPSLHELRINFAHFGGEQGVESVVKWDEIFPGANPPHLPIEGLLEKSWSYWIVKLIKTYPNAYADISAFDFTNKKAVASLAWLLANDMQGKYCEHGTFSLKDKLMWGSDIPMSLSKEKITYKTLFDEFYAALDFQNYDTGDYRLPKASNLPNREQLLQCLLDDNPRRFLFSQASP